MNILEITLWIELFLLVLLVISSPIDLLVHFWALMNYARVRELPGGGVTRQATIAATYFLVRGYLLDFIVNVFWMSVLLREWPRQLTVTSRLGRHAATGSGWRFERCERIQILYLKWFDVKHADGIHR